MSRRKAEPEAAGYTPPASPEAEQSVLGAILVRPEVLDRVVDLIEPADFYREAHSIIFSTMLGLYNTDQPIDLVTVTLRLKEVGLLEMVGGPVFLTALSEQVGFATNADYYARVVRDKAILRRLLDASQQIAGNCLAPVENVLEFLDAAEERILRIRNFREPSTVITMDEIAPAEVLRLERIYEQINKGERQIVGVPSGFIDLDEITGGFQRSDLIILAARPSMGKTALGLNIANYTATKDELPTLFFSLEQPKEQLIQRLLASNGSINGKKIRSARLNGDEWARLQMACGDLMESKLLIVDKPAMTTLEIRAQAKRLSKKGVGFIVIDYLQLVRGQARSREQEVGSVSRSLKALAKELDIPLLALCQLNRDVEKRPNKRPMLSDLRESGSIEQDADVVIFIYRDEVYKGKDSKDAGLAEIRVAKQRNGPTGKLKLAYLEEYMRFENYAREEEAT